jgi:ketosteroid isomerase-like protein
MSADADVRALAARVQVLEDEREILRTMYAYAHSIDYGDEALFVDCWADEAQLEWPWKDPIVGKEALTQTFRQHTHAPDVYHKHLMVEPRIDLHGDEADVVSLYSRFDRDERNEPYVRSFGRYIDRLKRCPDGRWRFTARRAENEAVVQRTVPK